MGSALIIIDIAYQNIETVVVALTQLYWDSYRFIWLYEQNPTQFAPKLNTIMNFIATVYRYIQYLSMYVSPVY